LFVYRAFHQLVRRDVLALLARAATKDQTERTVVTEEMLQGLPEPVQRYLTYTGFVGKSFVRTVYLKQKGRIRTGPGRPWMPLDAEEYYSVDPPGFVWDGAMSVGPLPVARARDMYLNGKGHMLVKAAALFTVADASGDQMDQGPMMRYLSEMRRCGSSPTVTLNTSTSRSPNSDTTSTSVSETPPRPTSEKRALYRSSAIVRLSS
jgi:hypothetical protein